jgi:hypothetical protein
MLQPAFGQLSNNFNRISQALIAEGFENVYVTSEDSTLVVGYENRRYRFEPRGIYEVIKIVDATVGHEVLLSLVIHHQKIPILYVELNTIHYRKYISGEISADELYELISVSIDSEKFSEAKSPMDNPSQFKADFVIVPQFRAQFGNFDRPVQANINIIPELNMLLLKGLSLRAQLIYPVYNNFYFDVEEREVRPGLITLNQMVRLDDNVFLTATAGFFSNNRAGTNLEFKKYFADGNLAIGATVGYTIYHTFVDKPIEYFEDDSYFTGLFSAEYRYQPYDLIGRIQAGRFLYNDLAIRMDILRQFGEVNIGFFALLTNSSEFNGGFNFAIPLPPGKFIKFKYLRLRQAKKFSWEYRAKGFVKNGSYYKTGNELFDIMLDYNPEFSKKRLINELP